MTLALSAAEENHFCHEASEEHPVVGDCGRSNAQHPKGCAHGAPVSQILRIGKGKHHARPQRAASGRARIYSTINPASTFVIAKAPRTAAKVSINSAGAPGRGNTISKVDPVQRTRASIPSTAIVHS